MRTDGMPPPDPKGGLRSTVAVPSAIESPSSSVPSGTRLWTPASASATLGPASSDCIAARAGAMVCGWTRLVSQSLPPRSNHTW
jgi:hypothetical protein